MASNNSPESLHSPKAWRSYIHPRREPFEYGLLPVPKLNFSDLFQTLIQLKRRLSSFSRINSEVLTESLQISPDHALVVLETLASVHHSDSDPIVLAAPDEICNVGADLRDLLLFLYMQSYKKLLPRSHKDSAAVADVWPSTSAFDGCLSALSPHKLARSNSRRFLPSQLDEEAHQLSYLQKHMANILELLADCTEGEHDITVLTADGFRHLGFFIQFSEKGPEIATVSEATPLFPNSDSELPAVPIPVPQVHDWLLQNIASALDHLTEKFSAKENGPPIAPDQDVPMVDTSPNSIKGHINTVTFELIEGVSKSSYVKRKSDLKSSSLKVANCHDSTICILAPLRYATVYGCSDATVVIGAVGKVVKIEHCERVHVITAAKRICIANCRECSFFMGVNQRPILIGDNHKLKVAPYNTTYPDLEEHMSEVGVDASVNRWNDSCLLNAIDPHDTLCHAPGISDAQVETTTCIHPDEFTNFLIPRWFTGDTPGKTKDNPFPLPDIYMASQQRNQKNLMEIKQLLRDASLDDSRKKEISCALHVMFKDWLYDSGNIRQLYCLQGETWS